MSIMFRLMGALVKAFFKTVFTAIISGAVAGGITLGVAYEASPHWPPKVLTDVAAIAIALLAAYAAGLTVVVREALKGVDRIEDDITQGARDLETAGRH